MVEATKRFKHLSLEERKTIFVSLNQGLKLKEISRLTGKDERTIAKEAYKHRFKRDLSSKREYSQDKIHVGICPRLRRFPRCCNGCEQSRYCRYDHYYYDAEQAYKDYRLVLKETRLGCDLDKQEFDYLNKVIKDGVDKGQSFYAIIKSNKGITKSSRTIYNYLEQHLLDVKNIDLRRKVKFKKRKEKYNYFKQFKDVKVLSGRRIDDYFKFLLDHVVNCPIQLDTVEGNEKSTKVLLTIHFVSLHFMLIYLLESQTKECVVRVFNEIEEIVGLENFKKMFPCILTDEEQNLLMR